MAMQVAPPGGQTRPQTLYVDIYSIFHDCCKIARVPLECCKTNNILLVVGRLSFGFSVVLLAVVRLPGLRQIVA